MKNKIIAKAWTVLVPGTKKPYSVLCSDAAMRTGQYVLFNDPDAKQQAEKLAMTYPEGQRFVVEVSITLKKLTNERKRTVRK